MVGDHVAQGASAQITIRCHASVSPRYRRVSRLEYLLYQCCKKIHAAHQDLYSWRSNWSVMYHTSVQIESCTAVSMRFRIPAILWLLNCHVKQAADPMLSLSRSRNRAQPYILDETITCKTDSANRSEPVQHSGLRSSSMVPHKTSELVCTYIGAHGATMVFKPEWIWQKYIFILELEYVHQIITATYQSIMGCRKPQGRPLPTSERLYKANAEKRTRHWTAKAGWKPLYNADLTNC